MKNGVMRTVNWTTVALTDLRSTFPIFDHSDSINFSTWHKRSEALSQYFSDRQLSAAVALRSGSSRLAAVRRRDRSPKTLADPAHQKFPFILLPLTSAFPQNRDPGRRPRCSITCALVFQKEETIKRCNTVHELKTSSDLRTFSSGI